MIKLDYPTISVENKTNEQNMQVTKAYLDNLTDQLNYQITQLEERIAALESSSTSQETS